LRRRTAFIAAGLVAFATQTCGAAAHDMKAHAVHGVPQIVAPADGATVRGPVTLRFRFAAMPARAAVREHGEPAGGHVHLLIDSPPPAPGEPVPVDDTHIHFMDGETKAVLDLPPGRHTLQLIVAGADHVPADPPVISNKVAITVKSGAATPRRDH
jgi:hypothetical protein